MGDTLRSVVTDQPSTDRVRSLTGDELVMFIHQRMDATGIGVRTIARLSGINFMRVHRILHRDTEKRSSIRMGEIAGILTVLQADTMQVRFLRDLAGCDECCSEESQALAEMLANLVDGLAERCVGSLTEIPGVDLADIRPEHGDILQKHFIELLEKMFGRLAVRREEREGRMSEF